MLIPESMKAMVLEKPGTALVYRTVPVPEPSATQVLVKIIACGVCRTDLHIIDGELTDPKLPLIPGHEIVGRIIKTGREMTKLKAGNLVGIPWLGYTCGKCDYCLNGQENLCDEARFTGYTLDGGYAEYTLVYERFCFLLPDIYGDPQGAPLLCAGLIGFRAYSMTGPFVKKLGIYGFGAAAHILTQLAIHEGKEVFAFTKDGDIKTQDFARKLGAVWAGNSSDNLPDKLDAAIIFAPVGSLVPKALANTRKAGTVVCGGIHMSDIPAFPYNLIWEERTLKSVANLTRLDGENFLLVAPKVPVKTEVNQFELPAANEALIKLRNGEIQGAAVLVMEPDFHK